VRHCSEAHSARGRVGQCHSVTMTITRTNSRTILLCEASTIQRYRLAPRIQCRRCQAIHITSDMTCSFLCRTGDGSTIGPADPTSSPVDQTGGHGATIFRSGRSLRFAILSSIDSPSKMGYPPVLPHQEPATTERNATGNGKILVSCGRLLLVII